MSLEKKFQDVNLRVADTPPPQKEMTEEMSRGKPGRAGR